jgi:hypothetical protein
MNIMVRLHDEVCKGKIDMFQLGDRRIGYGIQILRVECGGKHSAYHDKYQNGNGNIEKQDLRSK